MDTKKIKPKPLASISSETEELQAIRKSKLSDALRNNLRRRKEAEKSKEITTHSDSNC